MAKWLANYDDWVVVSFPASSKSQSWGRYSDGYTGLTECSSISKLYSRTSLCGEENKIVDIKLFLVEKYRPTFNETGILFTYLELG